MAHRLGRCFRAKPNSTRNGVLRGQDSDGYDWYDCSKCNDITGITFPSKDQNGTVAANAFRNCTKIQTVNLTNPYVTSIGAKAFAYCSSLSSITIPEGVTSISDGAFYGCSSLASITIPEGVTSIGNGAFAGCSSLSSITIPKGVASIGNGAFAGCTELATIHIPTSTVEVGVDAFYNMKCCGPADCNVLSNKVYNICDCKQC